MNAEVVSTSLSQVGLTVALIIAAFALLELLIWLAGTYVFRTKNVLAAMLVIPAVLSLALLILYPLGYELALSFSNMNLRHFKDPTFSLAQGWENLKWVFTQPVLRSQHFWAVFLRTILWTFLQVFFHTSLGLALALALNRKDIRFKSLFRAFLILPWAMPQVIAALTWRGEFHFEYGFINIFLTRIGLQAIQWKVDPFWNFVAMNITNIWLGIPFMMVIALGGLQSIDRTYYEVADVDGAGGWRKFTDVTLPLLKPVMIPAVMIGVIWTFNNFNIPYFINEMKLETSDILVTALFRTAFLFNQYGRAAAFALVIFIILFVMTLSYIRGTGVLKGIRT